MRPQRNAAENRASQGFRAEVECASMRPQRNAAENVPDREPTFREINASMRPQRNAAENPDFGKISSALRCSFNEAAA